MEAKRTLAQVEAEIAQTKEELKNVHGTETEVYARIVGYYRAVKHWNNGKRDEFDQRKMFSVEESNAHIFAEKTAKPAAEAVKKEEHPVLSTKGISYTMYTRKTCPNCPPVKNFIAASSMPGVSIDVDTPEGLAEAAKNGVFATPTVIFYNEAGVETARCHTVEELEAVFKTVAVSA